MEKMGGGGCACVVDVVGGGERGGERERERRNNLGIIGLCVEMGEEGEVVHRMWMCWGGRGVALVRYMYMVGVRGEIVGGVYGGCDIGGCELVGDFVRV